MESEEICEVDEFEEIVMWLDQLPLSRPKKNITKDFSDGVLLAEVLKIFYPKLVELHNYIKTSSSTVKVDNWTVLNRKVLRKLNLKLSSKMINDLATSVPGAIQKLLVAVRQKVDTENMPKDVNQFVTVDAGSGSCTDIVMVPIASMVNGEEVLRNKQMVALTAYHKIKRQNAKKDDEITSLTERVAYLETMVKLKDQRIKDMSTQLFRFQSENTPLRR